MWYRAVCFTNKFVLRALSSSLTSYEYVREYPLRQGVGAWTRSGNRDPVRKWSKIVDFSIVVFAVHMRNIRVPRYGQRDQEARLLCDWRDICCAVCQFDRVQHSSKAHTAHCVRGISMYAGLKDATLLFSAKHKAAIPRAWLKYNSIRLQNYCVRI